MYITYSIWIYKLLVAVGRFEGLCYLHVHIHCKLACFVESLIMPKILPTLNMEFGRYRRPSSSNSESICCLSVTDLCEGVVWLQPWGWRYDSLSPGWGVLQSRGRVTGEYCIHKALVALINQSFCYSLVTLICVW